MTFFFVLFCGLSKTQFNFLSSKGEWKACYCWTILKVFHLCLCDFHPFHDGKFSSHAHRVFMFAVRYHHHCCNVSPEHSKILSSTLLSMLSHIYTHRGIIITRPSHILFNDLVHSCVIWKENSVCSLSRFFWLALLLLCSIFLCLLHKPRLKKNSVHTFLSEDDLVVSLLAVIRSGYPVFSKQRPRSFTYSVLLPYFREKNPCFFLTLTIRSRCHCRWASEWVNESEKWQTGIMVFLRHTSCC